MIVLGKAPEGHIQRGFEGLANLVIDFGSFYLFY